MSDLQTTLLSLLPSKRKNTPSGWISFNSVCCTYRGESADTRQRGGILFDNNGGFQYHCFNCQFKAGWTTGNTLSKNTKTLFKWLGLTENEILKISFDILKSNNIANTTLTKIVNRFEIKQLPELSDSIDNWLKNQHITSDQQEDLNKIIEYIHQRGMKLNWYPWHWTPVTEYKNRLLIPFYHDTNIVGWTARKITDGKPKYLTVSQPGYLFNIDNQTFEKKYTIVVEGQLDAIAIDGVAVMHNNPTQLQCDKINSLNKETILVPDRDSAGVKMIESALNNNWSVSFPPWEKHIKDVADAVKNYGRLYTLYTILYYKESNKLKIELMKKRYVK